jgi:hypothetical protein
VSIAILAAAAVAAAPAPEPAASTPAVAAPVAAATTASAPASSAAKPAPVKPAPAKPAAAKPAPPRTAPVSTLIHSETFTRPLGEKTQSFRVDYTASLTWVLGERKQCLFKRCHPVCDLTVSHKVLSRQLWWLPPGRAPVLAENSPDQRAYAGGVVTLDKACAAVSDGDAARGASDRLRPYQFADEMMHDRSMLMQEADNYLYQNPPKP